MTLFELLSKINWDGTFTWLLKLSMVVGVLYGFCKWIEKKSAKFIEDTAGPKMAKAIEPLSDGLQKLTASTDNLSRLHEDISVKMDRQDKINEHVAAELATLNERTLGGRRHTDP